MRRAEKKAVARKRIAQKEQPRSVGLDYFSNTLARMGWDTPSLAESTNYTMVRLSNNYWLMLTLYRNHWLARRIVDGKADDMVRAWPKIVSDLDPSDITTFDRTIQRTYTRRQILRAIKWSRLYGGAGCLIAIKGHDKFLDEPLDLDDVNPGSYLGLIPFDRWVGIQPSGTEISEDFDHPQDWGFPKYYECTAQNKGVSFRVHASRIMRFTGPELPTPEQQAQMHWGMSVLEPVYEPLRMYDNARWAILNLLFRANIIARVDPDLSQILSGLGATSLAQQRYAATMQAQNELLSNQSMLVLGKDGDMKSVQYSFGGIGDVYAQFQMDVAGAAEDTVTHLFGRTVTGLGQTNDADEILYEQRVGKEQESQLRPALDKLYPVVMMSEFGEVPDDLDFTFPSVRVLTEEDKGNILEKASAPIIASHNAGVIGRQTCLKELKQLSDVTGVFSNITEEMIEEATDEIELPGEGDFDDEAPGVNNKPNPETAMRRESSGAADSAPEAGRDLLRNWRDFAVTVENPAGSVREGVDRAGNAWKVKLTHDYGYLHLTEGVDGDALDCFLGDTPDAQHVYVVHTMMAPDFQIVDEDKAFLDFASEAAARRTFFANYDRPEHFGSLERFTVAQFIKKAKATLERPELITA